MRMIPGMHSRHATKAALRRSQEPRVIPPAGLAEMPSLGHSIFNDRGWRNPLRGDYFDRSLWEAYQVGPESARVLAGVQLAADGMFEVSSGDAFAKVADPQAAFELAAGWAIVKLVP
ncbi:hypothetical protein LU699_05455 [Luteimonas fraxinea]|uniref:Uncharacterized protein n=1 Tax=Luteimonas fraxinea TaxID=2901869 RepID=A0ABS8UA66_9GAMM|nr:hypothetical protein [Luteimonas fraxinea]MCD9095641.1 hypothetical protein [Luteimonas fraxinea]MCD9124223.1 hypothetical protein [Luteimonas fraxinea]UHH11167.1 hypothetical protein LU699_05455 [Luteimonas fraxinea]